ncbi:MAG TPA: phytochelatin synthase family protein [Polyangia bacterium]|jgi:hypothetical protein|nr:phytochelatin synthase family protein [Polyangia bacterium]
MVLAAALVGLPAGAAALVLRGNRSAPRFGGVSIKQSSAYQNEALLDLAWELPAARAFGHRVDPQSNPTSCGPSSLANIERSFGAQSSEDSILHGTGKCWFGVCLGGLTLDELAEVARARTNHQVTLQRDLTYEEFREHLRHCNDPGQRSVINFHRGPLFGEGQGHGHHSPIGGFLKDRDLVFVLDVNKRFKPFLVDARRLFEAMDTTDPATGKKRGLVVLRRQDSKDPSASAHN